MSKRRELDRRLKRAGATLTRTTGGHEIWTLPNGRILPIPSHPRSWRDGVGRLTMERKLLKQLDSIKGNG